MAFTKKTKTVYIVISIFQIILFMIPLVLEYYSYIKMGMMRYAVYKNRIYSNSIFNPSNLNLILGILVLLSILMVVYILLSVNKKIKFISIKSLLVALFINLLLILFIIYKDALVLRTYYFFLISICCILALQCIRIVIEKFCFSDSY